MTSKAKRRAAWREYAIARIRAGAAHPKTIALHADDMLAAEEERFGKETSPILK